MKKTILPIFLILLSVLSAYSSTTVPVINPYTGKLDLVGPGPGLQPGTTYYLYQNDTSNAYWTFDGEQLCLYVNSVSKVCYTEALTNFFLLLEDGFYLLLEDGSSKVILE